MSFHQVFRLIFVIFSLYLMGDAFFRYDGVSYYSTFSNFLPSIALVSILWSIAAALVAMSAWLFLWAVDLFSRKTGKTINTENLLLFFSIMLSAGIIIWIGKRSFLGSGSSLFVKSATLLFAIIGSVFFTWVLRGKLWLVQERITPLVWIFGVIVMSSVPLVMYNIWIKGEVLSMASAQASTIYKNKPNILLITFDAMTARDMSVYGYERSTTPFINEWSKKATVFLKAEADGNYTFPTTLSLMTGQRAWTHRQFNPHGHKFSVTPENLARVLKNNNYYNIAYVQNPLASVSKLGISEYFDIVSGMDKFNRPASISGVINDLIYNHVGDSILLSDWIVQPNFLFGMFLSSISTEIYETQHPVNRIFDDVLSAVSGNADKPFFIWTHLNPPHAPYLPPEPHIGLFSPSSMLKTEKEQLKYTSPEEGPGINIDQTIVDVLRARYDGFIRYCDDHFKFFITQLEKVDSTGNTIIILSADHGESFEHDYITHGGNEVYEAVTHIPLIIKEPWQADGRIIDDLVAQIDISPTILDLAEIPVPLWMEGRSLKPIMQGQPLPEKPVFSMALYRNPAYKKKISTGTYAVREGDYKLIHYLETKKSLLFNLKHDPGEVNNLFDKETERGRRLLSIIYENLEKANEKIAEDDDSCGTVC